MKEAWLSERTKGWEAVALMTKKSISKSTIVAKEVKVYYQKSQMTAIVARVKKCVSKFHVVPQTSDSGSFCATLSTAPSASNCSNTSSTSSNMASVQPDEINEMDRQIVDSSEELYTPKEPAERRDRATEKKEKEKE